MDRDALIVSHTAPAVEQYLHYLQQSLQHCFQYSQQLAEKEAAIRNAINAFFDKRQNLRFALSPTKSDEGVPQDWTRDLLLGELAAVCRVKQTLLRQAAKDLPEKVGDVTQALQEMTNFRKESREAGLFRLLPDALRDRLYTLSRAERPDLSKWAQIDLIQGTHSCRLSHEFTPKQLRSSLCDLLGRDVAGLVEEYAKESVCHLKQSKEGDEIAYHGGVNLIFSTNGMAYLLDGSVFFRWANLPEGASGIAIDHLRDLIFVSRRQSHSVSVYHSDGTYVGRWGSQGNTNGQFHGPHGIAVDPFTDRVYVADTFNHRIQVFRHDGTFVEKWHGAHVPNRPVAITLDAERGTVFVVDANRGVSILRTNGAMTQRLPWFRSAHAIAVDVKSHLVYVADQKELKVFPETDAAHAAPVCRSPQVTSLAVAPSGTVYLSAPRSSRRFSASSQPSSRRTSDDEGDY